MATRAVDFPEGPAMTTHTDIDSDTFLLGGDLPIRRIGYGTMQLTGPGHWDLPADPDNARRILRRAIELGVNHIDTADAYGPHTVETLIREAIHPYSDDLVIATKGGLTRQGPNRWTPLGRPEYLRQCVELSLRRLAVDRIDLYYLHRVDPAVPLVDQIGALADLQAEGKIRHVGLSKVTVAQLGEASIITDIAAVQNRFTLDDDDPVLDVCNHAGIAYVPYAPLNAGAPLPGPDGIGETPVDAAGRAQAILTWLLNRSRVVLPIPGTRSIAHLEDNIKVRASLP
jgi:pyridoxine 4-dehydrogenase